MRYRQRVETERQGERGRHGVVVVVLLHIPISNMQVHPARARASSRPQSWWWVPGRASSRASSQQNEKQKAEVGDGLQMLSDRAVRLIQLICHVL